MAVKRLNWKAPKEKTSKPEEEAMVITTRPGTLGHAIQAGEECRKYLLGAGSQELDGFRRQAMDGEDDEVGSCFYWVLADRTWYIRFYQLVIDLSIVPAVPCPIFGSLSDHLSMSFNMSGVYFLALQIVTRPNSRFFFSGKRSDGL